MSGATPTYTIVRSSTDHGMEEQVNELMASGYRPVGGVSYNGYYIQAMMKPGMGGGRRKTRRSRRS